MTKNKQVIVILGPGRSGTSMLMQILSAFKMGISDKMIGAREHNEQGTFEDKVIFDCQNELISKITPDYISPLHDWLSERFVRQKITRLTEYIEIMSTNSATIWGFKDPRTALFIPMWTRVFNKAGVIPKYILATRNPADVVRSQHRSINKPTSVSELFWLTKNTEALYQTGGNCFIVNYEDWFTDWAPEIAKQLLQYTSLDRFWDENRSISNVLAGVVKPNLNRAVYNDYEVKNRYVLNLQEQLQKCRGDQFDRQGLMDVVLKCRRAMDEFSGWAIEAQRFFQQTNRKKTDYNNTTKELKKDLGKLILELNNHKDEIEQLKKDLDESVLEANNHKDEIEQLKKDLDESVLEANNHLKECKDFQDEIENFRITISVQQKESKDAEQKLKDAQKDSEQKLKNAQKDSEQKFNDAQKTAEQKLKNAQKDSEQKFNDAQKTAEQKLKNAQKDSEQKFNDAQKTAEQKLKNAQKDSEQKFNDAQKDSEQKLKDAQKAAEQKLSNIKKQITHKEKKIFSLQTSTSFQVGQILVNALAKPGKNTLLFPFYLLRTILASRGAKK